MISDLDSGSPFKLCSFDKSSSFSEYFLTFWNKMFHVHLVLSLPSPEISHIFKKTWVHYGKQYMEIEIWALGVLTELECAHCLQVLSTKRTRK